MLQEEKGATSFFQPLPFYYVEISKLLFHNAVDAFGENYMEVWEGGVGRRCGKEVWEGGMWEG